MSRGRRGRHGRFRGRGRGLHAVARTVAPALVAAVLWWPWAACGGPDEEGGPRDAGGADVVFPEPTAGREPVVDPDDFVGAAACADCHPDQYDAWRGSTHGRAGGAPTPELVLAPFDGAPIRFADAVVRPTVQAGAYVFHVDRRGARQTWTVDGVVGGGHMVGGGTQGFLTRADDGTVRFLPFDWSRTDGVWFCNTGTRLDTGWVPITRDLRLADCGDWPSRRIMGHHPRFANCQECHGSQIRVAFDSVARAYRTDWTTLTVNCESCHGPARRHVERMRAGDGGPDIGLSSLAMLDTDASLRVCFRCHALKDAVRPGWLPGAGLEDHYALKFPMLGDRPYRPDGRVRTFAYQATHLFSACYVDGSMTCTDCHEPHGQGYRDVHGRPLDGRFDDGQCTGCHASKAGRVRRHTHHPPDSPGSRCVACHMPYLQHPELGPGVTFARSDHTIPVPRPGQDETLGVPNACSGCHPEAGVAELQRTVDDWWGALKPRDHVLAARLAADTAGREAAARLLLHPGSDRAMAVFSALARFVEEYLEPDVPTLSPDVEDRLRRLATDRDRDVRALALAGLHHARGSDAGTRRFLAERLATEPDDRVRDRWALTLGYLGDRLRDDGRADEAAATYRKALELRPGPRTLLALGLARRDAGNLAGALAAMRRALDGDPDLPLGRVNLAIALQADGQVEEAAATLQEAIQRNPYEPMAYFTMGNLFLRLERPADAARFYERAVELDPSLVQGHVYHARARIMTGEYDRARAAAERALAFDPEHDVARQMLRDLDRVRR